MPHKQNIFNGLMVRFDKVDMKPTHTPDCANVDTFTKGALKNITGIEKQHTTAFGSAIIAVHQLNGHEFALEGTKLWRIT